MSTFRLSLFSLAFLLLSAGAANAVQSAQDAEMSVMPLVRQFPVTALQGTSAAQLFVVKNSSLSASRTIGQVAIDGVDASEFAIGSDQCSGQTLAAGASCSVGVTFRPLTRGTKSAELRVPSDDPQTPVITAFLTNQISAKVEAQQRMPPVLATNTIPETMAANQTYALSWTIEGYDDLYTSYAVLFDCTDDVNGTCGGNYGDTTKFAESPVMTPASVAPGIWGYRGETTQWFRYDWNFTVPATRKSGANWAAEGTPIVVRVFLKSSVDSARGVGSVSLLIPGNQSAVYFDTVGRRVVKLITP